jgi:2-polyprenyl-3-methyl-5-hydroxy-6-metoxy-1,4-benzoquinol methylase
MRHTRQSGRDWSSTILDTILAAAASIDPFVRAGARKLGVSMARFPRLAVIVQAVRDPFADVRVMDSEGWTGKDYTTNPDELARHGLAIQLISRMHQENRLTRVLEIACGEGVFTQMLAPHCDALLAVDFSANALGQAKKRCHEIGNVSFGLWDLRRDPIPGHFDLIVLMDVLTYVRRPARQRAVLEKVVADLRPGDLLLVGDYRWKKLLEDSWLGKRLLFGAKWVVEGVAAHPKLETLQRASTDTHIFAAFRRM